MTDSVAHLSRFIMGGRDRLQAFDRSNTHQRQSTRRRIIPHFVSYSGRGCLGHGQRATLVPPPTVLIPMP